MLRQIEERVEKEARPDEVERCAHPLGGPLVSSTGLATRARAAVKSAQCGIPVSGLATFSLNRRQTRSAGQD